MFLLNVTSQTSCSAIGLYPLMASPDWLTGTSSLPPSWTSFLLWAGVSDRRKASAWTWKRGLRRRVSLGGENRRWICPPWPFTRWPRGSWRWACGRSWRASRRTAAAWPTCSNTRSTAWVFLLLLPHLDSYNWPNICPPVNAPRLLPWWGTGVITGATKLVPIIWKKPD